MKIAFIIPTLDASGAEKQLTLLAENLPRAEFEVRVITLDRGGPYVERLAAAGIPVVSAGKRLKADPWAFHRLVRILRDWKPEIVQTWLFAGHIYGQSAARLAHVPFRVASYRCVDRWKHPLQLMLDRKITKLCHAIIANTHAVQDFYVAQGLPPGKFRVIPNAAVPPIGNSSDGPPMLRETLGIPPEARLIGFIGRLSRQKRVKDAIWALDILRIGNWNVELAIVGQGPDRALLERFARNIEVTNFVHFLGARSDVANILRHLDVLVLPSDFEGMPNVILEAMCLGIPVVATRIAGMDEVVSDGDTGLLVPVGKPLEIARAVSRILDDPEFAKRLSTAAKSRAEQQFPLQAMIDAHAALFRSLASRS